MLESVSDDKEFNQEVQAHISERRIVKVLQALRTAKGVSQSEIAKQLKCSQSRLSKLENGIDNDLRLGELEAYAKAMECDIHIVFTNRNSRAIDRIQNYAGMMHAELLRLAKLAKRDEEVAQGVAATFGEVLINQMKLLQLAASKLPNNPQTNEPYLKIDTQFEACEVDPAGEVQDPIQEKHEMPAASTR